VSTRLRRGEAAPEPWTTATWQAASLLLGYPDDDQRAHLPLLRDVTVGLPSVVAEPLRRVLDHLEATPAAAAAAAYVETFDHRRRCAPFLTYYTHGDTRKRGMALLRLKHAYRAAGTVLTDEELPDHLAVVLEFAATVDAVAGRRLLLEHRAGVELLRLALEEAGSPYAGVLHAVCATLPALDGDGLDAVRRLIVEGPPAEEVGLEPFGPPEYMPETTGARR
jgi:nitrate reductase molybdenum cofactor assembly chaperone NarJ/NarW